MVMGRPAYRFAADGVVTVFADNGEVLPEIHQPEAMKIAGIFTGLPEARLHYVDELNRPDQWTLESREQLPLHKITTDDGMNLYVSETSAEVELMTTRGSRALAWVAAIPHWMYFMPLRIKDDLWRKVVLWTSGVGGILALLGIILSIVQFPVRYSGLMRWHYVTGTFFEIELEGLGAVCLQHEMDHLEGKLFVDYLSDLKRERIRKKLDKDRKERASRTRETTAARAY